MVFFFRKSFSIGVPSARLGETVTGKTQVSCNTSAWASGIESFWVVKRHQLT